MSSNIKNYKKGNNIKKRTQSLEVIFDKKKTKEIDAIKKRKTNKKKRLVILNRKKTKRSCIHKFKGG